MKFESIFFIKGWNFKKWWFIFPNLHNLRRSLNTLGKPLTKTVYIFKRGVWLDAWIQKTKGSLGDISSGIMMALKLIEAIGISGYNNFHLKQQHQAFNFIFQSVVKYIDSSTNFHPIFRRLWRSFDVWVLCKMSLSPPFVFDPTFSHLLIWLCWRAETA